MGIMQPHPPRPIGERLLGVLDPIGDMPIDRGRHWVRQDWASREHG